MAILIAFCVFIILLMLGMNIGSVLLITGILGIFLVGDYSILINILQSDVFARVAGYTLTTIPLFILMSQFFIQAGIVKDLYAIVYNYSRGKSGILGSLTIILGAVLGSISGSGSAASAALGQVAIPELKKHGYKDDLSGAIAASAGALSGIIPPSIILILYGATTQTPVNKLFMGAVIPGILLTVSFILSALFYFNIQKKKNSLEIDTSFQKKEIELRKYIVTLAASFIIMVIIFVGIYFGFFTATEAGAVGAFVSLLAVIALGKFNFQLMKNSIIETIKVSGMVMFIMIGAQIFARFISLSLLPNKLISFVEPILQNPIIIILILTLIYFVLFMLLEGAAVIVMTVPLTLPIILEANIDPIWFGVLVGLTCTIGLLTPPVGLSVFAVSSASKVPLEKIFKITMVFSLIATVITVFAMIVFPELATWLPNTMK